MLRISATTIDEFRKFQTDLDYEEEYLLNYITGVSEKTKYMDLGVAFHNIIENPSKAFRMFLDQNPDSDETGFIASNGIYFPWDAIAPAIDTIDYNFPFEVKTTKRYNIKGEEIEVVSKVDQLVGVKIMEFKTAWSYFGKRGWKSFVGDYEKSAQWKLYLDAFEINEAEYHVFVFSDEFEGIQLLDHIDFKCRRKDGMKEEINLLLEDFTDYIQIRNLQSYFTK